ncbi:MAG: putative L-threonine 3-dehydrogenase [Candidatus Heimdallarchaeota archaeon LC_3]|nr:MAG: putative L-threonine 3-dehydrogenase [Candidatus Heimdallarchaeota archaeon LC_3]
MKAIYKSEPKEGAEIRENVDIPKPKEDQVLIKVEKAGICGTDIHIYKWDTWAQNRMSKSIPLIFGHEVAGKVVEIGKNVSSVQEGDLVSAETHVACGKCYHCKTNKKNICKYTQILGVDINGIFADYAILTEENVWVNDSNLDPNIAAVLEPIGNAVHTALPENNIEDIAGKTITITGCGPIGLYAIALVKQLGADKVIATEVNPLRIDLAKKMGADLVINPMEEDVIKTSLDFTDNIGTDVLLEMSGYGPALVQGLKILTPGGRVSLLGLFSGETSIDLTNLIVFKSARVFGISGRRMFQTWYQVKGLLRNPNFRSKINQVVTHEIPLKQLDQAMEKLLGNKAAKIVLTP